MGICSMILFNHFPVNETDNQKQQQLSTGISVSKVNNFKGAL